MYNYFVKKSIIFVNMHGYGDILHSRQGVRWAVDQLGDQFDYYFIHVMHEDTCFFHEKIKVLPLPRDWFATRMIRIKSIINPLPFMKDALWVDVWAASFEKMIVTGFGHKLPDENGNYHRDCEEIQDTTEWQVKLWQEKIKDINEFLVENFSTKQLVVPDHKEFVCKWNSNPRHKFFADRFLDRTKDFDLHVLICNGDTTSGQRKNFVYEDILSNYIISNPNICFYLTAKINEIKAPNVFYIDNEFPKPNLDEIEYLMKFCDVIVTSQSGPGCLAFTDAIVFDETKTLIIFCGDIVHTYFSQGVCEYVRTSNFEDDNILNTIKTTVEKKLSLL